MIDLQKLKTAAASKAAQNHVSAPKVATPVVEAPAVETKAPAAFGNSALDSLLNAAGDGDFKDVDPGTYLCEITKCEMGKTKAEQKDMFVLGMKVVDGDATGEYISQYRVLTKKDGSVNGFNVRLMKEWLTTLTGQTPATGNDLMVLTAHVAKVKPMVQVTVTHDTWGADNRISVNISNLKLVG